MAASWLSRPDKFGRGNIIVQRLGHVDKADCLPVRLLASVCVFLRLICSFQKCGNDLTCNCRKKTSPLSNRTVIAVRVLRPKTASCSETGNSQNTMTVGAAGSVHCIIIGRLMVKAPMQKTLCIYIYIYICTTRL